MPTCMWKIDQWTMTQNPIFICLIKTIPPPLNSYQSNWYDQFTLEMCQLLMNYPATKLYKRGKSVMEPHLWAARVVCIADAPSLCCHIYCSTNRPGLKQVTCTNYIRLLDLNNNITNAFILGRKEWKDKDGYLWIPWAVHCNNIFLFHASTFRTKWNSV